MVLIPAIGRLVAATFRRWVSDGVFSMSAAIAFYAAFAMVPGLLILMAVVDLLYGGDTAIEIEQQVAVYVGPAPAEFLTRAVLATTDQMDVGPGATALAILMTLVAASALFAEVLTAMNRVWRVSPRPGRGIVGVFRDRFWPFTLFVAVGSLLVGSLLLSAFIRAYSVYIDRLVPSASFIWHYVDLGLSFAVVTILFGLIFKFLPDARVPWIDAGVGAAVTSSFFTAGKHLFGLYLGTTAIQTVYGAAGSLLVILIWVYVSTSILLLGAEFTHVYSETHGHGITPKAHAMRVD